MQAVVPMVVATTVRMEMRISSSFLHIFFFIAFCFECWSFNQNHKNPCSCYMLFEHLSMCISQSLFKSSLNRLCLIPIDSLRLYSTNKKNRENHFFVVVCATVFSVSVVFLLFRVKSRRDDGVSVDFCLRTCSQGKGYRHTIRDVVSPWTEGFSGFLWIKDSRQP